jgi:hypothetical protein
MSRRLDTVQIDLNLKLIKLSGQWKPNDAERLAAWELYVELLTRVSVAPLSGGLLREALTSLYSVFSSTRQILRTHGPILAEAKPQGEYNFGFLAIAFLNFSLRPVLTKWHPALEDWESERAHGVSRLSHEEVWKRANDLREDLAHLGGETLAFAEILATACNVPDLRAAIPQMVIDSESSDPHRSK